METTIHYIDNVAFEATIRGHRIVTDLPPAEGGHDTGPTPPELVLAGLGTCAGFYALQYLKLHSLPKAGLSVRVTAEKQIQPRPARMAQFRIEVTVPSASEKDVPGLLRAVKGCLIHNTLTNPAEIETVVFTGQSAEAQQYADAQAH